jgi:hypothetical protein
MCDKGVQELPHLWTGDDITKICGLEEKLE